MNRTRTLVGTIAMIGSLLKGRSEVFIIALVALIVVGVISLVALSKI